MDLPGLASGATSEAEQAAAAAAAAASESRRQRELQLRQTSPQMDNSSGGSHPSLMLGMASSPSSSSVSSISGNMGKGSAIALSSGATSIHLRRLFDVWLQQLYLLEVDFEAMEPLQVQRSGPDLMPGHVLDLRIYIQI